MGFIEWYEEFELDLKIDFTDDELDGNDCRKIIQEDFLDEVCDEIMEDQFRAYCYEKHDEWEQRQKEKSQ